MEEYLVWTVKNTLTEDFLNLLTQVRHLKAFFVMSKINTED